MVIEGPSPLFDRVVRLADRLRRSGLQVSTGELIDAARSSTSTSWTGRHQAGLRATMVKEPLPRRSSTGPSPWSSADEPDGLTADGGTPDALASTAGSTRRPAPPAVPAP
jgi:hypothetical protein